jgi:Ser/Thr protein kinase RdoA (MazF antagonist)
MGRIMLQINEIVSIWQDCQKISTYNKQLDKSHAKKRFIKKLKKLNYKIIGNGTFKLVLSKKSVDFVVKIYHTGSVDDQIVNEHNFKKYLVKSIYNDGIVHIQPKAKRNSKRKAYKFFEDKFGRAYCEINDIHSENVGWIDDQPVIFDYVACEL